MSDTADVLVLAVVAAARLLLPLLILRFPLVGILVCLLLDGVDQTVFELFTDLDLGGYQGYDKALDIYYLSLAYISTMRNWVSTDAYVVAQALYYYRLAGTAAFELTGAEHRELLLLFPNTFEYFFIAYEVVRSMWDPARLRWRWWVTVAAAIWIGIKLPQEYWIHIAQLDVTDLLGAHPWLGAVVAALVLLLAWYLQSAVRPVVPPAEHELLLRAGPLPTAMDELAERQAHRVARGTVLDLWLLEKVVLVSFVSIIFAEIMPGVVATPIQIAVSSGVVIVVNSFLGLAFARRGRGFESALMSFVALSATNVALVLAALVLQRSGPETHPVAGLFFILLLTLVVTLYDRYRPVVDVRGQTPEARAPFGADAVRALPPGRRGPARPGRRGRRVDR